MTNQIVTPRALGGDSWIMGENMNTKQPAVYILANRRNGILYVGVTSDLLKRIWEHRSNLVEGFTKRHKAHTLVFFEIHKSMGSAIQKEKRIKKWNRAWKIRLIEKNNPTWRDLYKEICK
jgi:putative endonuclease